MDTQFTRLIHLVAFDTFENLSSSQASEPTPFLTSPSRFRNPTPPNTRSANTIDYNAAYRELLNLLESQGLLEEQKVVLPNITLSEPPRSEFYEGPVECDGHPTGCRCSLCSQRRERRRREQARRRNARYPHRREWHEYRGDVDEKYFNRNLWRDNDERRILQIADVLQVNGRERALVEAHALGLVFAIGETREMTKRHDRAERLRIEREEALERMRVERKRARVARAEYAARMHPLVKLVLPNQYHMSVRPTTRSHRGMRHFRRSRARHLAWMD